MTGKHKAHKKRGKHGRRFRKRHENKTKQASTGGRITKGLGKSKKKHPAANRTLGGSAKDRVTPAPVLVAFVPISKEADCQVARSMILSTCLGQEMLPESSDALCDVTLPGVRKTKWTLLPVLQSYKDTFELLRLYMAAELVVFISDGSSKESVLDETGVQYLKLFKAVGMTSCVTALQNLPQGNLKQIAATKKHTLKLLTEQMGDGVTLFPLGSQAESQSLLLHLQPDCLSVPHWRHQRPSVFIQNFQLRDEGNEKCSVALEGFVRYAALSANQIITVPGFGDYAIDRIITQQPPVGTQAPSEPLELLPDPARQHSLIRENAFVPEEEMKPVEEGFEDAVQQAVRHVPKGTSEYQAAWIPATESLTETETDAPSESNALESQADDIEDPEAFRETQSIGNAMSMGSDSDDLSWNEEEMDLDQKKEDEEEDKNFPNEVKTPHDQPARARFQRYRGLKSFRTSPWDAKADLPVEYSRIFEFDSFARAAKSAKKELSKPVNAVSMHAPVSVVLKDVPTNAAREIMDRLQLFREGKGGPLVAVGLMEHETKMSVVHYRVRKAVEYETPIASKERFCFVSGFRWFHAAPVFSTDNPRYDKHQMEKFLHAGSHVIASIYGQITFPAMPLLAFKGDPGQPLELAFTGILHSCAPERVILKHIILTGRVSKAFKKRAVVKGMFHDPEDVRWFKPLELWTKCGRSGYIKESLGTKGHMKCYFDGPIQHHDTVCISLYRRVFPVWLDSDNT